LRSAQRSGDPQSRARGLARQVAAKVSAELAGASHTPTVSGRSGECCGRTISLTLRLLERRRIGRNRAYPVFVPSDTTVEADSMCWVAQDEARA
jgi:hypothetical protein